MTYLKIRLHGVLSVLKKRAISDNIGWLFTPPHALAINTYTSFLGQNPNHIGNWSTDESIKWGSTLLEFEVIQKLAHLYKIPLSKIEGYVTSGGTESNLYSAWAGRSYLLKKLKKTPIALIHTDLSHYSIAKAADIVGVDQYICPLDEKSWSMSPEGLQKITTNLAERGYKGFLLPLTLGYTQTGTHDDIEKLLQIAKKLERSFGVRFFAWVDASLNGLIVPFVDKTFAPLRHPLVHTFLIDYHKMGLAPYPAGILLYKKGLRKLIERPISYLPFTDTTVLGSRPGASSATIWTMMHFFGREGYTRMAKKCLDHKAYFMARLHVIDPDATIVTHKNSPTCGVIFKKINMDSVPVNIKNSFGLFSKRYAYTFYPNVTRVYKIYKFYFLPHLNRSAIDKLLTLLELA